MKVTRFGNGFAVVQAQSADDTLALDHLLTDDQIADALVSQSTQAQAAIGLNSGGHGELWVTNGTDAEASMSQWSDKEELLALLAGVKATPGCRVVWIGALGTYQQHLADGRAAGA